MVGVSSERRGGRDGEERWSSGFWGLVSDVREK
jgi:hypothetical protein